MKNTNEKINSSMTKEEFIENFKVTFISTWVSINYDE